MALLFYSIKFISLKVSWYWIRLIDRDKGAAVVEKLGNEAEFAEVNINDSKSLEAALDGLWFFQLSLESWFLINNDGPGSFFLMINASMYYSSRSIN